MFLVGEIEPILNVINSTVISLVRNLTVEFNQITAARFWTLPDSEATGGWRTLAKASLEGACLDGMRE